jgi:hypothetical protein
VCVCVSVCAFPLCLLSITVGDGGTGRRVRFCGVPSMSLVDGEAVLPFSEPRAPFFMRQTKDELRGCPAPAPASGCLAGSREPTLDENLVARRDIVLKLL